MERGREGRGKWRGCEQSRQILLDSSNMLQKQIR